MSKHVILFPAANPLGTTELALGREAHAIQEELERSGQRDRFEFVTRWAVQPLDLIRELRKLKPTVVHFSGHGGSSERQHRAEPRRDIVAEFGSDGSANDSDHLGGLSLQGPDGHPQLVTAAALRETFGAAGTSVKLVILNACYSSIQAEALLVHIDCVVGIGGSLRDDAARAFAIGFYGGLGERQSVAAAYRQGCAAISLEAPPDGERPHLRVRDGVDANEVVLAEITAVDGGMPIPTYPDDEVEQLSKRLEDARARKKRLCDSGIKTDDVDREILELRRQLREGGQLRAGDALSDGRYLLVRVVGRGGFAVVWEAYDCTEQQRVAIKVLHTNLAGDPQRRERFFRGAQAMMRLTHSAVTRVLEPKGEDGGFYYFVMEFIPGGNLREAVLERRVENENIFPLILRIGDALALAHARGMIHRDIKPANILLDEDGDAKLTDFDLVSAHDTTGGTRTGALGTVIYAAPECLDKPQEATARADVYGLGMTVIFCLFGRDLSMDTFRSPGGVISKLDCSIQVQDVLRRAVAWESDERFADTAAMMIELRNALNPPNRREVAFAPFDASSLASRSTELPRSVSNFTQPSDALGAPPAARRRRGVVSTALASVVAAVSIMAIQARTPREREQMIDEQVAAASTAQAAARQIAAQRDVMCSRALRLFDDHHWDDGEAAWAEVDSMREREENAYRSAAERLDIVLRLAPQRSNLREQAADLTFERLVRAEQDRRGDLVAELRSRLNTYGDRHQAELKVNAHVELSVSPVGTHVSIERAAAPPELVGSAPVSALTLPAGSLVLVFEAPGRVAARLPVLLVHGETLAVQVVLPAADTAPPDMLYVPADRFLFGSADSTDARHQFNTVPLHEISIPAYYIARHEVTFGEWIEFLDTLPLDERRRRSPRSVNSYNSGMSVVLTEITPRHWQLSLTPTTRTYRAETGERLHYERRVRRADQDWTRFPVAAVSFEDATAFAAWLDRTRRVPGARLCDEYEWERAARGADARMSPSGSSLAPDDANIDVTYGRDPLAFGPDEVGSHPASRSPVGADDMAGNVWEWTRSVRNPGAPVHRGGSWYQGELTARSMNRENGEPTLRNPLIGLRLCATPR